MHKKDDKNDNGKVGRYVFRFGRKPKNRKPVTIPVRVPIELRKREDWEIIKDQEPATKELNAQISERFSKFRSRPKYRGFFRNTEKNSVSAFNKQLRWLAHKPRITPPKPRPCNIPKHLNGPLSHCIVDLYFHKISKKNKRQKIKFKGWDFSLIFFTRFSRSFVMFQCVHTYWQPLLDIVKEYLKSLGYTFYDNIFLIKHYFNEKRIHSWIKLTPRFNHAFMIHKAKRLGIKRFKMHYKRNERFTQWLWAWVWRREAPKYFIFIVFLVALSKIWNKSLVDFWIEYIPNWREIRRKKAKRRKYYKKKKLEKKNRGKKI